MRPIPPNPVSFLKKGSGASVNGARRSVEAGGERDEQTLPELRASRADGISFSKKIDETALIPR